MAGWTTVPVSAGDSAHAAAPLQELVNAADERSATAAYVPSGVIQFPASTGDAHTLSEAAPSMAWRLLQERVEDLVPAFADTTNYPSPPGLNAATGEIIPFTLATARAAAGLDAGGFTRRLPDGSTMWGLAQSDDSFHHAAMFNEIRAMLNILVATVHTAAIIDDDTANVHKSAWSVSSYPTVAAAEVDAATVYAVGPTLDHDFTGARELKLVENPHPFDDFSASIETRKCRFYVDLSTDSAVDHLYWYVKPRTPAPGGSYGNDNSVFSPQSQGAVFAGEGEWVLLEDAASPGAPPYTSGYLGNPAEPPDWPGSDPAQNGSETVGWIVDAAELPGFPGFLDDATRDQIVVVAVWDYVFHA